MCEPEDLAESNAPLLLDRSAAIAAATWTKSDAQAFAGTVGRPSESGTNRPGRNQFRRRPATTKPGRNTSARPAIGRLLARRAAEAGESPGVAGTPCPDALSTSVRWWYRGWTNREGTSRRRQHDRVASLRGGYTGDVRQPVLVCYSDPCKGRARQDVRVHKPDDGARRDCACPGAGRLRWWRWRIEVHRHGRDYDRRKGGAFGGDRDRKSHRRGRHVRRYAVHG